MPCTTKQSSAPCTSANTSSSLPAVASALSPKGLCAWVLYVPRLVDPRARKQSWAWQRYDEMPCWLAPLVGSIVVLWFWGTLAALLCSATLSSVSPLRSYWW